MGIAWRPARRVLAWVRVRGCGLSWGACASRRCSGDRRVRVVARDGAAGVRYGATHGASAGGGVDPVGSRSDLRSLEAWRVRAGGVAVGQK